MICSICTKEKEEFTICEDGLAGCKFMMCEECYDILNDTNTLDLFLFDNGYICVCKRCDIELLKYKCELPK